MRYYPVSIDTLNKKILIIGGGKVALRKTKSLLKTEFSITVVSKDFLNELIELNNSKEINIIKCQVDEDFNFASYDYIIIATDQERVNTLIENKAKDLKIPFLNSSIADNSDFIMNKVINKNLTTVSISTGGKNPSVSTILSKEIEIALDRLDKDKIEELNSLRKVLKDNKEKNINKIILDLYYKDLKEIRKFREDYIGNKNRE